MAWFTSVSCYVFVTSSLNITRKVSSKSKVSVRAPSPAKHGQSETSSADEDVAPSAPTKVTKKSAESLKCQFVPLWRPNMVSLKNLAQTRLL